VSRVKPGSERSRVDFFYKLIEWNVGESQWAVLGCRGPRQQEHPDTLSIAFTFTLEQFPCDVVQNGRAPCAERGMTSCTLCLRGATLVP
jgi:hypothetical protein